MSAPIITFTDKELRTLMKKQGEFFGYPVCCTRSFCRFFMNREKYPRHALQDQHSHGEGFVPCVKHAKLLSQKKITYRDMIQNRICTLTFAFDDYLNSENFRRGMELQIKINGEFEKWLTEQNQSALSIKCHESRWYNQKKKTQENN